MNQTPEEFTGDFTVVIFPFVKVAKKKPEDVGNELGNELLKEIPELESFNVEIGRAHV